MTGIREVVSNLALAGSGAGLLLQIGCSGTAVFDVTHKVQTHANYQCKSHVIGAPVIRFDSRDGVELGMGQKDFLRVRDSQTGDYITIPLDQGYDYACKSVDPATRGAPFELTR